MNPSSFRTGGPSSHLYTVQDDFSQEESDSTDNQAVRPKTRSEFYASEIRFPKPAKTPQSRYRTPIDSPWESDYASVLQSLSPSGPSTRWHSCLDLRSLDENIELTQLEPAKKMLERQFPGLSDEERTAMAGDLAANVANGETLDAFEDCIAMVREQVASLSDTDVVDIADVLHKRGVLTKASLDVLKSKSELRDYVRTAFAAAFTTSMSFGASKYVGMHFIANGQLALAPLVANVTAATANAFAAELTKRLELGQKYNPDSDPPIDPQAPYLQQAGQAFHGTAPSIAAFLPAVAVGNAVATTASTAGGATFQAGFSVAGSAAGAVVNRAMAPKHRAGTHVRDQWLRLRGKDGRIDKVAIGKLADALRQNPLSATLGYAYGVLRSLFTPAIWRPSASDAHTISTQAMGNVAALSVTTALGIHAGNLSQRMAAETRQFGHSTTTQGSYPTLSAVAVFFPAGWWMRGVYGNMAKDAINGAVDRLWNVGQRLQQKFGIGTTPPQQRDHEDAEAQRAPGH